MALSTGSVLCLARDPLQSCKTIGAFGARIVMNSGECGEHRLFIINFDKTTGTLELDTRFRDPGRDRVRGLIFSSRAGSAGR